MGKKKKMFLEMNVEDWVPVMGDKVQTWAVDVGTNLTCLGKTKHRGRIRKVIGAVNSVLC